MNFHQLSVIRAISTTETNDVCNKISKIINKIPLTDLLVGVVVPIVAAWISYALANRATKRKEFNKLFIQIELIEKELLNNQIIIQDFISRYEEKYRLQSALEIPIYSFKSLLIEVLDKLIKIKRDYFYFDKNHLFEKPNLYYIIAQNIEDIDLKIRELESSGYSDIYLDDKRKDKLLNLYNQKDDFIAKLKENKDRNIYNEFNEIQSFIERNSYGKEFFKKNDMTDENYIILRFIFNTIKSFNDKPNKVIADVADLYEKLILFEISSDIIVNDQFNQDNFDICKLSANSEGLEKSLYDTYEKYYKLDCLEKSVANYIFDLLDLKWQDNNSDLVLISDSKLYIEISDLYEGQIKFQNDYNEKLNVKVHEFYNQSKKINEAISSVVAKLEKHKLKIEKWCR